MTYAEHRAAISREDIVAAAPYCHAPMGAFNPPPHVRQDCPECGGSGLIASGATYGGRSEFVGCPFCPEELTR